MNNPKKALKVMNLILVTVLFVAFASESWAQSGQYKRSKPKAKTVKKGKKGAAVKKDNSGKLDISDLEKKYWAPKDTDFSVVQNRTYSKSKKYVVSPQYGMAINDSYSKGNAYMLTGNYFFDERHGVEVTYQDYDLKDSALIDEFLKLGVNTSDIKPNHGKIQSYYGIGYTWVPVYAKVSVLGKKIIYLDMAITPTMGMTQYDQQKDSLQGFANVSKSAFTYGFDLTQYFFFDKNLAIRADLRNRFYTEEVMKYNEANTKLFDKTTNTTTFSVGVSVYF